MKIYKALQAAVKIGISKQSLMRYEKLGLVPKQKRNRINSWREYTQEDIENIKRILKKGITMIELVMVIMIISIISVAAIPRIQSFSLFKLSGAVKALVSDIRYVQQIAVARHTSTRLTFNTIGENYTAEEEVPQGSSVWQKITSPFTKGDLAVNYRTDPQYGGININSADFNGASFVLFDWTGSPQSNGTVVCSLGNVVRTVSVEGQTGKVSVR